MVFSIFKTAISITIFFLIFKPAAAQDPSEIRKTLAKGNEFRKSNLNDLALYYFNQAAALAVAAGNREEFVNASNHSGILLTRMDQYEEAKKYLQTALDSGLANLGNDDLLVATTYLSLGVVYSAENDFVTSLDHHNRSLSIRLSKLGENHADVATSYGNIGNVHLRDGKFDKALDAHMKAMKIRTNLFGDKSVEVTQSYTHMGNVYRELKNYDQSLNYFQKALENKIIQVGEGHKDLSKFYKNISDVYFLMNDNEQGEAYRKKVAF